MDLNANFVFTCKFFLQNELIWSMPNCLTCLKLKGDGYSAKIVKFTTQKIGEITMDAQQMYKMILMKKHVWCVKPSLNLQKIAIVIWMKYTQIMTILAKSVIFAKQKGQIKCL